MGEGEGETAGGGGEEAGGGAHSAWGTGEAGEEEGDGEEEAELVEEAEAPPETVDEVTEEETDRRTATAEELLRAARAETLGRCLSERLARSSDASARKRSRNTLRVVAAAVAAVVQNDAVIDSLVRSGVALSDMCEVRAALTPLALFPPSRHLSRWLRVAFAGC